MSSVRSANRVVLSHENMTQNHNLLAPISYSFARILTIYPMKGSPAMQLDAAALEDLGRATHKIVHDLKNQLNGLKLYATFLRKRLERDDHSQEERETVAKLIAGLDRAAKDLTALVRYAQPLDLRQQTAVDLRSVLQSAARDPAHRVSGALSGSLLENPSDTPLIGIFDPHALAAAFSALAREAFAVTGAGESNVTLHAERSGNSSAKAYVEWRGINSQGGDLQPGLYAAFAKRVIEAHGGVVEFDHDKIRVTLPLSE